jgi:lipoate-protein ligase A
MDKWRVIPFSWHRASENMAIDEAIFRLFNEYQLNTIRFYGWNPSAVSIGKNQSINNEVDLENLNIFGFDIVRRISGGGAVFHDSLGELTYSIVVNKTFLKANTIEGDYYELAKLIFNPLEKLGLVLDYVQIHCPSVFSSGKKISGNAQARSKNSILQHGTILTAVQPEIMYSVLKARPGKTREHMVESVYQHVTTLSERLGRNFDPIGLSKYLTEYFTVENSAEYYLGQLTKEELALSNTLLKKYNSNDWLFSKD